jgi:protein-disulfide isomerase
MAKLKVPVTQHDHIRGPADAAVTLIEYGDYECDTCAAVYAIVNAVQERFANELSFVFRHFPLKGVHPNAEAAAESAEFAAAHNRFWEMHDGLYKNQSRLGLPLLLELAQALGLSESELRRVLDTGEYASKVRGDFRGGARSGVNGTPTFFINGRRHDGSFAFDGLVAAIELQLRPKPSRWWGWRPWPT